MYFPGKGRLSKWGLGVVMGLGLVAISAVTLQKGSDSKLSREYYLTEEQIAFVRPGLELEIQSVAVAADRSVSATFSVSDERGLPLDLDGVFTPGPIRARFVLAHIPGDQDQYVTDTTEEVTSPITDVSAVQGAADSGGTFEKIDEGTYRYTFGTPLPPDFDPDATHSVGVYADRDLSEFGLDRQVANTVVNFLPSGGEVNKVRDVVSTQACNQCHDPLEAHGGFRRQVALCVLCHNPGQIDPDTGESVDFPVLIHRIHRGGDLPSVQAGQPFQIIGFQQRVNDFGHIEFPQDIRYCDTCHQPGATSQAEAYLLRPNMAACGSCHDDVVFSSGENHPGGPQISNNLCAFCHFPEGELEFDASIIGAHTVPEASRQLEGIQIEIVDVANADPGANPTVFFWLRNHAGETLEPSSLPFFNLVMAGPTTDYSFLAREAAMEKSVPFEDGFTYTFETPIPADATGTFAMGSEAFRDVLLNPGTTAEFSQRESAENPVFYFAVTDPEPAPRRTVVLDEKCEGCHRNLALHGGIRHDPEYCVLCHQPAAQDGDERPADQLPTQTIDFKFLIHRIHTGEDLTRDFTVFGFGGRAVNFNEEGFSGDRRNCAKCHQGESYFVPSKGILPTVAEREFFSPIAPNAAACLACHDELAAAAHAFLQIAPFGEACGACHGEDSEFSVARVHAR
ncbi:MAG: OmcA/MtrC family decaheme c-type cytochrome [Acidobacteriota bacterium]